jgi:hypothetical protein
VESGDRRVEIIENYGIFESLWDSKMNLNPSPQGDTTSPLSYLLSPI